LSTSIVSNVEWWTIAAHLDVIIFTLATASILFARARALLAHAEFNLEHVTGCWDDTVADRTRNVARRTIRMHRHRVNSLLENAIIFAAFGVASLTLSSVKMGPAARGGTSIYHDVTSCSSTYAVRVPERIANNLDEAHLTYCRAFPQNVTSDPYAPQGPFAPHTAAADQKFDPYVYVIQPETDANVTLLCSSGDHINRILAEAVQRAPMSSVQPCYVYHPTDWLLIAFYFVGATAVLFLIVEYILLTSLATAEFPWLPDPSAVLGSDSDDGRSPLMTATSYAPSAPRILSPNKSEN
jgi:hypothetical protein